MISLRRSLTPVILLLVANFSIGTIGYRLIEGWSLLDAFYMTSITLTTVGFGEIKPLSTGGRIFTIALIFLGVSTAAYGFSTLGDYLLTAGIGPRLRRRRLQRMVDKMKNHTIICGYGRVAQSAVVALQENDQPLVVIEIREDLAEEIRAEGIITVQGDATRDETLRNAGIERAKAMMVCGGNDADNLFIVLSARSLNAELYIVTRSIDPDNEPKMRRAGANRVVSPYKIGGQHMANMVVRPHVTEFLDVVNLESGLALWLEELWISEESDLAGQTVVEADLRRKTGVTLVALIQHETGDLLTPDENTRLQPGDELIVLGTREQLAALERMTDKVREA